MFSTATTELRELVRLVAKTERYDVTLAAKPDIEPTEASRDDRRRKARRKMELLAK
ncbi:hypothetical protein [Burkholderia pseudomallei]|uniref:hypothetical protein n=1 Tax=Burkholderia pseudomallei TaxID=28450 RepID=UPI00050F64EC|nr:hypothetical protein [Burkholderia pseudomallei]AIV73889.1 hypothetical protein X994_6471 [Burkholderia pseudomallei]KGC96468.1 hypothetical protein DP62_5870 [Burkholderia pseudomallei]KGD55225.1 hypothetical protein DP49_1049 [Burkholderia pseudomallei]KGW18164.1 hypothetical protein X980_6058 [Burkholderia pseudomallei MSHR4000]KGW98332.1 hypothetical protein Y048_6406 [Burkholderia pseudomallei MSHR456]